MKEKAVEDSDTPVAESFTAVPDVTVWPNLTQLPDGTILLAGFDKPSHGQVEGDVACWASEDEGTTWTPRGTITAHEPKTVRMNHAIGLDGHGHLVALVGGWTDVQQPDAPKRDPFRDAILPPWVCRSTDGGRTWERSDGFPATDPNGCAFVAFGDIVLSEGGRLNVSAYTTSYHDKPDPWGACFLVSEDDGKTWQLRSKIAPDLNETALLNLGDGKWLAASREKAGAMRLLRSTDDGVTWRSEGEVAERLQHPGHLLRLKCGNILLTYGDRRTGHLGVVARVSADGGKSWDKPVYVASMPEWDGGYPYSLEREDGRILTVFYAKAAGTYSARAVIWDLPD